MRPQTEVIKIDNIDEYGFGNSKPFKVQVEKGEELDLKMELSGDTKFTSRTLLGFCLFVAAVFLFK